MSLQDTFDAIRDAAEKQLWSQGVELSRRDAVSGESMSANEVKLLVLNKQTGLASAVSLFLDDAEWVCDCLSDDDPCLHVVTAVIALKRAREQGQELPVSKVARGPLAYQFCRTPRGLTLHRFVQKPDKSLVPFQHSAASVAAGRVTAPDVLISPADVDIERQMLLDEHRVVKPSSVPGLLAAMSKLDAIYLDDKLITASEKIAKPVLVIEDDGPQVRVHAGDAAASEYFFNGMILRDGVLHPAPQIALTPSEADLWKRGRRFGLQELAVLNTELIPRLRHNFELVVKSAQLGDSVRVEPYIEILNEVQGESLVVRSRICYGKPLLAYVDQDRLVQVHQDAPIRMREKELFLRDHFTRHFGFAVHEVREVHGTEAIALADKLTAYRGDLVGNGFSEFHLRGVLQPRTVLDGARVHLSFEGGAKQVSPQAVLTAWKRGETNLRLPGEGFFSLPEGWMKSYGHALQRYVLEAERSQVNPCLKAAIEDELAASFDLQPKDGKDFSRVAQQIRSVSINMDHILSRVKAKLRPYQSQGVDWLCRLQAWKCGAILADDMGLGKTLQAIAVMGPNSLVIAPTSLIANWSNEIRKFRPDLSVGTYHGPQRILAEKDVTITSYAIARIDAEKLASRHWSTLVVDEAQYIKNPESLTTQAIYTINADFRVALSGTPIENRLEDLWSEMHFANPGLLGRRQDFRELYERPIARGEHQYLHQLRSLTSSFVLRRLKSDVAKDLPPRNEIIVRASMSDDQRAFYESTFARAAKEIDAGVDDGKTVVELLEVLLRVRQACCSPRLIPGVSLEDSAKLDCIEDMLTSSLDQGHRVLVFSQWTKFLDLIEARVNKHALRYLRLDGTTKDRQQVVAEFQNSPEPLVLLMSLKAGGVGLNLTAADHVIIADPWWNPAAEDQAADRAHRIGQTKSVFIHKIIADGTIEEKILALQQRKRALALAVLESGDGFVAGLGRDDIKELFL